MVRKNDNFIGPKLLDIGRGSEKTTSSSRYGAYFVDTSIGEFTTGDFGDDKQYSRLLTLRFIGRKVQEF